MNGTFWLGKALSEMEISGVNYRKKFEVFERILAHGGDAICREIGEKVRSGESEIPVTMLNPDFGEWFKHHPDKCTNHLNDFLDERFEQRGRLRHFEVQKLKGRHVLVVSRPHHRDRPSETHLHAAM
jgi:hypothetical protein